MTNEKLKEIKERLLAENDKRRRVEQEQVDACANYYECGVNDALTAVSFARPEQAQPAADVAPVVHGRWIRFKEPDSETGYIHMRCSVCTAYWSDPSHADHFCYCPSCGAKMDG